MQREGRKPHVGLSGAALGAIVVLLASSASAQTVVDWHEVAAGGGTSTGGAYEVSGTVGQPDAGPTLRCGSIALQGWFWALIGVLQTDGAPALGIFGNHDGTATLTWAVAGGEGFLLQVATDLELQDWTNESTPPAVADGTYQVTVPLSGARRTYRLWKP